MSDEAPSPYASGEITNETYVQFMSRITLAYSESRRSIMRDEAISDIRPRDMSWSRDGLETHFTGLVFGLGLGSKGLGLEGKRRGLGLERIRSRMFQDHSIVHITHNQTIIK